MQRHCGFNKKLLTAIPDRNRLLRLKCIGAFAIQLLPKDYFWEIDWFIGNSEPRGILLRQNERVIVTLILFRLIY